MVVRRPRVLFVGDDQSSPEIAANLLRRLAGDEIDVVTAGARPTEHGGRADDILVQMGLNPASEERLSVRELRSADRVVVLGTRLDVARVPGRRYEEWDVENDDLADRVRRLFVELRAEATAPPAPPGLGTRVVGAARTGVLRLRAGVRELLRRVRRR